MNLRIEMELTANDFIMLYSQAGALGYDDIGGYVLDLINADREEYKRIPKAGTSKNLVTFLCERNLNRYMHTLTAFKEVIDNVEKYRNDIINIRKELGSDTDEEACKGMTKMYLTMKKHELDKCIEILDAERSRFYLYMDGKEYDWGEQVADFKAWYKRNVGD